MGRIHQADRVVLEDLQSSGVVPGENVWVSDGAGRDIVPRGRHQVEDAGGAIGGSGTALKVDSQTGLRDWGNVGGCLIHRVLLHRGMNQAKIITADRCL